MKRETIVPAVEGFEVITEDNRGRLPWLAPPEPRLPVIAWSITDGAPRPITPLGLCERYDALLLPDADVLGYVGGALKWFANDDEWRSARYSRKKSRKR